MKKVVVLGAGLVGKAIAIDLSKNFDVTSADINEQALAELSTLGIQTQKADIANASDLQALVKPFDLVVTNALLHHLLEVESFVQHIRQWVAPSGYYIAGHEPNYNFYVNEKLVEATRKFQQYKRLRQRLTWRYCCLLYTSPSPRD